MSVHRCAEVTTSGRRTPRSRTAVVRRRSLVTLVATVALAAGCSAGVGDRAAPGQTTGAASPSAPPTGPSFPTSGDAAEGVFASIPDVVRQVEPSVVTILREGGLGSGVVYRQDGLIVTNEHVVRGVRTVQVAFADGRRSPGRVRAVDPLTDLAVVQTERQDLPAARFHTRLPRVGELAVAMGSPLGLQNTATAGIISGLHREIPGAAQEGPTTALVDLIQTDAAISPGNSGGALANAAGEVTGINVAYLPPQAGAVSLGFAIPAATMQDVVGQLIDTGRVRHAFLGIQPAQLTPEIAAQLGLTGTEGVLILEVVPGGPADDAGLRPGDVITTFGGTPVRTVEEFLGELRQVRPGASVTVEVLRNGRTESVQVTIADRPQIGAPPG